MAVGGIGPNRKMFPANLMPGTDHLPATLNIAEAGFSKGQPQWAPTWPMTSSASWRCTTRPTSPR